MRKATPVNAFQRAFGVDPECFPCSLASPPHLCLPCGCSQGPVGAGPRSFRSMGLPARPALDTRDVCKSVCRLCLWPEQGDRGAVRDQTAWATGQTAAPVPQGGGTGTSKMQVPGSPTGSTCHHLAQSPCRAEPGSEPGSTWPLMLFLPLLSSHTRDVCGVTVPRALSGRGVIPLCVL